ncbi:MAG: hypothetical protein MJZ30_03950 [Paludibacteraceae bacterium]|nr:hypothetical protein [Paludibacteraceae bacterium]
MNKKLLMLLLAGFSFAVLPSCGDEEDDNEPTKNEQTNGENNQGGDNNQGGEQQQPTGLQLADITGSYTGSLYAALEPDEPIQEGLGVVVSSADNKTLSLAVEPIEILGIQVDNIAFDGIPATYDAAADAWNFTASGLKVDLLGGMINADVDVKQGVFTKDGLTFTINVKTNQDVDIDLNFVGKKK